MALAVWLVTCACRSRAESAEAPTYVERFQEIWRIVRDSFFDPHYNGADWVQLGQIYGLEAAQAHTDDEFASIVNQMLAELHTSHTHLYTSREPEYFQLCGTFWPFLRPKLESILPGGKPDYPSIGIFTQTNQGRTFVRDVLDGSPAAQAGLRPGDELLSVNNEPFAALNSFTGKTGHPVQVQIRRTAGADPVVVSVTPQMCDAATQFLDAVKASVEVVDRDGVKVGYIHMWSYAGDVYQMELEDELNGRLRDADALVLDLRDGPGGASPSYLWPFFAPSMTQAFVQRDQLPSIEQTAWSKPVCLLVNEGTRSGKEPLTYLFKKSGRGPVVGTKTAGAVMAGHITVLSDGSLLMVPTIGGTTDGLQLEGHGVAPTVEVPFSVEYTNGVDPQRIRAIDIMCQAVREKPSTTR